MKPFRPFRGAVLACALILLLCSLGGAAPIAAADDAASGEEAALPQGGAFDDPLVAITLLRGSGLRASGVSGRPHFRGYYGLLRPVSGPDGRRNTHVRRVHDRCCGLPAGGTFHRNSGLALLTNISHRHRYGIHDRMIEIDPDGNARSSGERLLYTLEPGGSGLVRRSFSIWLEPPPRPAAGR